MIEITTTPTYGPALQKMINAFPLAKEKNNGWWAHPDNPTFDFREEENGTISIKSWTNRSQEEILAMGKGNLTLSDIRPRGYSRAIVRDKLDLLELAQAKKIHWRFLESLGLQSDYTYHGYKYVKVPYHLPDGSPYTKTRVRLSLTGKKKYGWDEGTYGEIIPYGLHKLDLAHSKRYLLIGEGESDAWPCWLKDIPYLGVPGANFQKCLRGIDFNNIPRVYILHEPDQVQKMLTTGESFYKNIHQVLRANGYTGEIFCVHFEDATECKDPSDLWLSLWDNGDAPGFHDAMMHVIEQAIPANDAQEQLVNDCATIDAAIESQDPLKLFAVLPQLAQLPKIHYLPYELKIKNTFANHLNMNSFNAALAESRKTLTSVMREDRSQIKKYETTDEGMIWNGYGEQIQLSNFTAEIIADITTDDGVEQTRSYELNANIFNRQKHFDIPAKEFTRCEWIDEHLGARAMITTGQSMKSHLINSIKYCSDPQEQFHYAHTGWRLVNGQMVFLHNNGCVSQVSRVSQVLENHLTHQSVIDGSASRASLDDENSVISQVSQVSQVDNTVRVKLSGPLTKYVFPKERGALELAIRSSLSILDLTNDKITVPLYCSIWRAPLGNINYGVHLSGQTGLGKTELIALIQQHYGETMDANHLPGSWESTDNSLEMLLFQGKDVVVVVDDFKPKGNKSEQDRLHSKADRVFRQIGNGAARGRLTSNLEQRAERRPRCLLLSTGEDVPRGQSLKARSIVVSMSEPITTGEASIKLSKAQKEANAGMYAQAMAGYLEWLAPQIEEIQVHWADRLAEERDALSLPGHARSGTNTANMLLGMKHFLRFAIQVGALTEQEAHVYLLRCTAALKEIASEAARENYQDRPAEQWLRLISASLAAKTGHLVAANGDNPGVEYGWVQSVRPVEREGSIQNEITYKGGGKQIGWIDGQDIYLLPAVAYAVAREMGSATGDEITTVETTLRKFLTQDKILASTDLNTPRHTITVRRRLERSQQNVLHLAKGVLYPDDLPTNLLDSLDILDSTGHEPAIEAGSEVSQVVDLKGSESSKVVDSLPFESTKQVKVHQDVVESEYKKLLLELRARPAKEIAPLGKLTWRLRGSGYESIDQIPVKDYFARLVELGKSGDSRKMTAGREDMLRLLGRGESA